MTAYAVPVDHTTSQLMAEVAVAGPAGAVVGRVAFGGWQLDPVPPRNFTEEAYLVRVDVRFGLEPGVAAPERVEAGFEFSTPEVSIVAAVPGSVQAKEPARTYALTSMLNFVPADDRAAADRVVRLDTSASAIEASGFGSPSFRWQYTAARGAGIDPGSRTGWFVLLVPPGTSEIRVRPRASYALPVLALGIGAECVVALSGPPDADGGRAGSKPPPLAPAQGPAASSVSPAVDVVIPAALADETGAATAAGPPRLRRVPAPGKVKFSGVVKLEVCRRLDNWPDLVDYFEVPANQAARFPRGEQARSLWAWLEARERLDELPFALDAIGRPDLAALLRADAGL